LDAVAARNPGLLDKFGGHAMAAGMSLPRENFSAFAAAFDAEVRRQLQPEDMAALVLSDGELKPQDFDLALVEQLRAAGPWGQHFPEPLFDGEFFLVQQRIVGERHLKLVVALDAGRQQLIDAIAFNVDVQAWPNNAAQRVRLAYRLDINEYRDKQTLQLLVEYIEACA
jgi:single-stranded-DNA-specific exonuclease